MKKFYLLLLTCIFGLSMSAAIHVKPAAEGGDDSNDGSSWEKAKATIGAAISSGMETQEGNFEVWIQKGTYTETASWGTYSAEDPNLLNLFITGGFKGDEIMASQREKGSNPWEFVNETIVTFQLDGETKAISLNGDEISAPYCIIDGISFRDGKNVSFEANDSGLSFNNCTFSGNKNDRGSLIGMSFFNPTASYYTHDCLFENNEMSQYGGDLINIMTTETDRGTLSKIVCIGNKGQTAINYSSPISSGIGLGMADLDKCIFYNNDMREGIVNLKNNASIANSLFYNNNGVPVSVNGGVVAFCTIANNKGKNYDDGGIAIMAPSKIYNTILRGNTGAYGAIGTFSFGTSQSQIKNCAFPGGKPDGAVVANNRMYALNDFNGFVAPTTFIGADPAKTAELAAADWSLSEKPHGMIDSGDPDIFSSIQSLSGSRYHSGEKQGKCDIGAYESKYTGIAFPTLTVTAGDNGTASTDKSGDYFMGAAVELTATPDSGYDLTKWTDASGATVSEEANFTYAMPETSTTLTANFEKGGGIEDTRIPGLNVYASAGKLYVNHSSPVIVEVYTIAGGLATVSEAASNHTISLQPGIYMVVAKDGTTQDVRKIAITN
ncbi:InlB B-repeat-containing protein [Coprobacter tertius]|uniref:Bacterial repeat domain-containing protein n=1 Tax=Coprobacter tertius TaxID=2944915 RepID=A0ABT1MGK2_9BACT|nr:hypothetical protein [Coprobacter tertius]MCP9611757.1 hypothetical protein [Coprobacter tertius]